MVSPIVWLGGRPKIIPDVPTGLPYPITVYNRMS